jgi:hypothetical protein
LVSQYLRAPRGGGGIRASCDSFLSGEGGGVQ